MTNFIADQSFKNQDYTQTRLSKGEYENCIFEGCKFENGYLDNQNFMECEFMDCNLSNANLNHTIFKEVTFSYCKMIGLKFEDCNDFLLDFTFRHCILNLSSFYGLTLRNQTFNDCKLIEVDFTETDLTQVNFENSHLDRAIFSRTNLQKADFTKALNFDIDPEINQLKHARFSKEGLSGLLSKYNIKIE